MSLLSANLCVDALGDAIADEAELVRAGNDDNTPGQIWTHEVDEKMAATTYTLLRIYSGRAIDVTGTDIISIQSISRGQVTSDTWTQALKVFALMRDDIGRNRQRWQLEGYVLQAIVSLRQPGQVSRDDRGRVDVAFNFEAAFIAAA